MDNNLVYDLLLFYDSTLDSKYLELKEEVEKEPRYYREVPENALKVFPEKVFILRGESKNSFVIWSIDYGEFGPFWKEEGTLDNVADAIKLAEEVSKNLYHYHQNTNAICRLLDM